MGCSVFMFKLYQLLACNEGKNQLKHHRPTPSTPTPPPFIINTSTNIILSSPRCASYTAQNQDRRLIIKTVTHLAHKDQAGELSPTYQRASVDGGKLDVSSLDGSIGEAKEHILGLEEEFVRV
ncbi:unnamed protein product [Cyclocybe aegerita]|uniref:Uncharacterized protein n=1 Tax=Cyclocybe aegerita TaxID=1973307 RepID=A0A8S0WJ19_CYCAE|nr:unnamed protein product [Cyclocybe aegerita]